MTNKTLVFSIALNGYQWLYQKELATHKHYAKRYNYDYQAVTRPSFSVLGVECCWLKLTLMRTALLSGYESVMFIDADAVVKKNCPPLETLYDESKYLYMAKGYSNRFNSGILIALNNPKVINWLQKVIDKRMQHVLDENSVGWGENGHIIELSHNCPFICEIDQRWNNTFNLELTDFIQHKNCGPLRTSWLYNFIHRMIFFLSNRVLKFINAFDFFKKRLISDDVLGNETAKIILIYPNFLAAK